MAAAAALSVAVHAAVLLGRASAGSSTSSASMQAPVLLTRSVLAAAPIAGAPPGPESPPVPVPVPMPAPSESVVIVESPKPAPEPAPIDRNSVAEATRLPTLHTPVMSASAVAATPLPEVNIPPAPTPQASPPIYLGSGGLDPPPRPLTDIDPAIPVEAGARGGVVVLRLFINERGGVDKAEVLNAAPPGLFDASALEAFGNAKFSPGFFAGVPVKSQVTFEVKFRGLGNGTSTSGRTY